MKGFKCLSSLELDLGLLWGPPHDPTNPIVSTEIPFRGWIEREVRIPTVGKLCPDDIERLSLFTDKTEGPIKMLDALFADYNHNDRNTALPHLKHLKVELRSDTLGLGNGYLRDLHRKTSIPGGAGVELHEPAMASFQRSFNRRFGVEDVVPYRQH